jgi:16S rRNA (cytidine1402-2'-O)-methyltransferase
MRGSTVPGSLYVVSTPIGNVEDISLRALRILKEIDIVAAEDPLPTKAFLDRYGICIPLTSYHNLNKQDKAAVLLSRLKEGQDVAIVCDAGTPAISDPGSFLIAKARASGIRVVPVPGASAVIAAFSISGFSCPSFAFYGSLPEQSTARRRQLQAMSEESRPMILFESPEKLRSTLQDMRPQLGNRRIVLAKDMTKHDERFFHGRITDILKAFDAGPVNGEITLVVEGTRTRDLKVRSVKGKRIRRRSASE